MGPHGLVETAHVAMRGWLSPIGERMVCPHWVPMEKWNGNPLET
jgi:hypothetical protein